MYKFSFPRRILTFFGMALAGLVVGAIVMGLVVGVMGVSAASLRINTVIQDVTVFILPALATAVMVSWRPADMLGLRRGFTVFQLLCAVAVMVCSMPVMNLLIEWNASLSLPSWASGLEAWMKATEENAQAAIKMIMEGPGAGVTIVAVLIVGVLAGLSEELFFRGALQRILGSGRLNVHAAIWITAVIFSLFHMQFYGFFPRVLLGAFFGYLLWWSGSIWLPVLMHALNNSIYVIAERSSMSETVNQLGTSDIWMILGSVICTAALIYKLAKSRTRDAV